MTSNPPLIRGDIVCSRHKLSPIVIRWHSSVLFVCVTDEVCQSPLDGLTPFASVLVLIIRDCIHLNVLFGASRTICSNIANCWSGPPGIPDLWCWSIEVHQYIPSYASSLLYTAVCRQPLSTYILKLCHSIIMELSITLRLSLSVHCLQIPNFHL